MSPTRPGASTGCRDTARMRGWRVRAFEGAVPSSSQDGYRGTRAGRAAVLVRREGLLPRVGHRSGRLFRVRIAPYEAAVIVGGLALGAGDASAAYRTRARPGFPELPMRFHRCRPDAEAQGHRCRTAPLGVAAAARPGTPETVRGQGRFPVSNRARAARCVRSCWPLSSWLEPLRRDVVGPSELLRRAGRRSRQGTLVPRRRVSASWPSRTDDRQRGLLPV